MIRAATLGTFLAAVLTLVGLGTAEVPGVGDPVAIPFTSVFAPPQTRAEVMVNRRDGPAFAQLATDLTLARPGQFNDYLSGSTPNEELAYRASRPMLAWILALLSAGGQRALLAPALLLISVISLGAAAAAVAFTAERIGRDSSRSWISVLLPGLAIGIFAPGGCEPLALALTLFGWTLWSRDGKTKLPVLLWALAALTRETSLIVPIAVALATTGPLRRRASALVLPLATYGFWLAIVWWRTGVVPTDAGGGRTGLFFSGLTDQVHGWGASEWAAISLIVVLGIAALRLDLSGVRVVLAFHVILASLLGSLVWEHAVDFSRVFALVSALGLVALLPRRGSGDADDELSMAGLR